MPLSRHRSNDNDPRRIKPSRFIMMKTPRGRISKLSGGRMVLSARIVALSMKASGH